MGICNEKATADLNVDYYKTLLSSNEYKQAPIVAIDQAIEPLLSSLPSIRTYVQLVKDKCLHPADGLTLDESAAIMLYSMIWQPSNECIYLTLNSLLLTLDQSNLQPWLLYLKLFFTALLHLPSNYLTVYRGSQSNVNEDYHLDQIIHWWDLPLCTSALESLQTERVRTLLTIKCHTIRNIEKHSFSSMNHFLIFLPGTKFQVTECSYADNGDVYSITLQEIDSSFLLHCSDTNKSNRNPPISFNSFQKFCFLSKKSTNPSFISNDHYRNPSLEHRIIGGDNSWSVDLDRQNLTDRDMRIVVKYAINKNRCKRICLRDNNITSQGSAILSEALYNNTLLESLDLRNNRVSDLGVQVLASASVYSNIKTLNFESNEITSEGALYLAQMLRNNRTLTELYLSKNRLGDRGVELIANALFDEKIHSPEQSNKRMSISNQSILQHLYLGHNEITDVGVKHLSEMLKCNRTLTWLWLTGNEISNDGVEILTTVLAEYNATLEWLFLNSNKLITDSSVDDLIHMLKRNQTLKTLYLNNCNLSEITKRKLLQTTKTKKDFDLEV